MKRSVIFLVVIVVLAMLAGGAALASSGDRPAAQSVEDDHDDPAGDVAEGPDVPITGSALDKASAAALAFTGEGRVTATEVGDEESYYEVEVTLDNGREIDVQLDEQFVVVGTD